MVQSRPNIPHPPLEEFDLEWAVGVWQDLKNSPGLEEIRTALSICRYWRVDRLDLLRRATRGTEVYNELKNDEETLEVYITDLNDALWTTAHINKMTGAMSGN